MSQAPPYKDPTQPTERRLEDLLARMTLPEKVGQLLQLNGQVEPVRTVQEKQPGSLLHILNEELLEFELAVGRNSNAVDALRARVWIAGQAFSFAGIPGAARLSAERYSRNVCAQLLARKSRNAVTLAGSWRDDA